MFVTGFAWGVIVVSIALMPISFISLLMILVGSYGTENVEPLGALVVLAGPPASFVAGIGLLRRQRWAWGYAIAVLGAIFLFNLYEFLRTPAPPATSISADGVRTTVYDSTAPYAGEALVVSALLLAALLSRRVRAEFPAAATRPPAAAVAVAHDSTARPAADAQRGWRVGHRGRDGMYYEERRDGVWQRLEIDGEMLTGRAHHAVYLDPPERWRSYPAWARERREEIVARIRSEFRAPDYEYGVAPSATDPEVQGSVGPHSAVPRARGAVRGRGALLLVVVVFLALAGGMGWLAGSGVRSGETYLPSRRAAQSRSVSRAAEPVMFWTAIGLYAAVGAGALGGAAWLIREGWRLR